MIKNQVTILFICTLCVFLHEASLHSSYRNKLHFFNSDSKKLADFLKEQEVIALIKAMEVENQKRREKEKENEIFRNKLASRVQSSIFRDFFPFRY